MVWIDLARGLLGIGTLVAISYALSSDRKAIDWRLVGAGLALQLVLAILVLKVPGVEAFFRALAAFFVKLLTFAEAGSKFIFGETLMDPDGFEYIFAFKVLPTVIFFSALTSLLYYLGVLQRVVYAFAWLMSKTMRMSGAESLAAAGNIFVGQTEAPLLIKPYLEGMTRSEVLCLMTGGMATIAGGVFAAYVGYLGGDDPATRELFATHLLTASIISAPAAIVAAKILLPEKEAVSEDLKVPRGKLGTNVLDAITNGTIEGTRLAINVGVMLLVFIALIELANFFFSDLVGAAGGNYLNDWVSQSSGARYEALSLQYLLGLLFAPFAWLLGVPSEDVLVIGQLLGEKTIINEFVAYVSLGKAMSEDLILHPKSTIIATYALCGFANFASIGIQIGGISALAPSKRTQLAELGIKALIGGTIATFFTATIAGMLYNL